MLTILPARNLLMALSFVALTAIACLGQSSKLIKPERDPNQPVDEEYTRKIREYTTETFFNSPLTDYLPASKSVPTPKAVIGDIAGAPVRRYGHGYPTRSACGGPMWMPVTRPTAGPRCGSGTGARRSGPARPRPRRSEW